MRHRYHRSKLNRTSEHRLAMMRNLAIALVRHERIHTTKVKAAQLRPFVEPLVTLARKNSVAAQRNVFAALGDRETVAKLFSDIGPRVASRDGGYLRIVSDGPRMGDGAPMAYIEFVDPRPKTDAAEPKLDFKEKRKKMLHERRKERNKMAR